MKVRSVHTNDRICLTDVGGSDGLEWLEIHDESMNLLCWRVQSASVKCCCQADAADAVRILLNPPADPKAEAAFF